MLIMELLSDSNRKKRAATLEKSTGLRKDSEEESMPTSERNRLYKTTVDDLKSMRQVDFEGSRAG